MLGALRVFENASRAAVLFSPTLKALIACARDLRTSCLPKAVQEILWSSEHAHRLQSNRFESSTRIASSQEDLQALNLQEHVKDTSSAAGLRGWLQMHPGMLGTLLCF